MGKEPVKRVVRGLNGISIAYMMGLANSALALLSAFGVNLTEEQQAAITGFVNAFLVVIVHVSHRVGEEQVLHYQAIKKDE